MVVRLIAFIGVGLLLSHSAIAAPTAGYVQQNAIETSGDPLPPSILNKITVQKLVMVGETHGTNEGPALVGRLTTLLSGKYKSILVGLEIPHSEQTTVNDFLKNGDLALLQASQFFNSTIQDGRESQAMVRLLQTLRSVSGVQVVCFDITDLNPDRDLGMAQNFVAELKLVQPDIAITLSGNCHSKIDSASSCDPKMNPMGVDVLKLSGLNQDNVLSLNIERESGSAWVSMSDFAGVHQFASAPTVYSESVPWTSYFLIEPSVNERGYNGAFFFRKISYSLPFVSPYPRVASDIDIFEQTAAKMNATFDSLPQDTDNIDWVKSKLDQMFQVDQFTRSYKDIPLQHQYSEAETEYFWLEFRPRWAAVDAADTSDLKELLKVYPWITISQFGEKADDQAWLIVQHADNDPTFQADMLKLLEQMYAAKETKPAHYAYLYDRVAASWSDTTKQKPQRYGTQGMCKGSGDWEPIPIEDFANIDKRRADVGLDTFADYKKRADEGCH